MREKWEYNVTVPQLFINLKETYVSVRREVLYSILIKFGISKNLVDLITICLYETFNAAGVGKNLFESFPVQNGLKQGDAL
jgi:hypothetical protein